MAGLGGEERLSHGCQVHVGQRRDAGITHREGVAATLKFSELRGQCHNSDELTHAAPNAQRALCAAQLRAYLRRSPCQIGGAVPNWRLAFLVSGLFEGASTVCRSFIL